MTLSEAKRKLPKFAKGLSEGVTDLLHLRAAVQEEINSARNGSNPLEPRQIEALQLWLAQVARRDSVKTAMTARQHRALSGLPPSGTTTEQKKDHYEKGRITETLV